MCALSLPRQLKQHDRWKHELVEGIGAYQAGLEKHQLLDQEARQLLELAHISLQREPISIAFVGEHSQGKSELINALFFSRYAQRILPSMPDRCTLCPSELSFDPLSKTNTIRLLPIETCAKGSSLKQFKAVPEHWITADFDLDKPQSIRIALSELTRSKRVSLDQAVALGFEPSRLRYCKDDSGEVIIPAWRYAMINIDHPFLRQGLRIIDCPTVHNLGSGDEISQSILHNCQALVFLCNAADGVKSADIELWDHYIRPLGEGQQCELYVALNKIDLLKQQTSSQAQPLYSPLQQAKQQCARALNISADKVHPLSAKLALIGRIRQQHEQIAASGIEAFEKLLCAQLLEQREQMIAQFTLKQLLQHMSQSRTRLQDLLDQSLRSINRAQQQQLAGDDIEENLRQSVAKQQRDAQQQLLRNEAHRRLINRQQQILNRDYSSQKLEETVGLFHQKLQSSWNSLSLHHSMHSFFALLGSQAHHLREDLKLADKVRCAIYQRYNDEGHSIVIPSAASISLTTFEQGIARLHSHYRGPKHVLRLLSTEKQGLIEHFFAQTIPEVESLCGELLSEVGNWSAVAMKPLMQGNKAQQDLLDHQLQQQSKLKQQSLKLAEDNERMQEKIKQIAQDMQQLDQLGLKMQLAPPSVRSQILENVASQPESG